MTTGVVRAAIYAPETKDHCESWRILTDCGAGEIWRHGSDQEWHGDCIQVGFRSLDDAMHATAAALRSVWQTKTQPDEDVSCPHGYGGFLRGQCEQCSVDKEAV